MHVFGQCLPFLLLLAPLGLLPGCVTAPQVRVMSFNIRYGTAADGEHRWENRRELVLQRIRDARPDILGLQEVLAFQADELQAALPALGFVGVGREDGQSRGEFAPIMYRRRLFDLQDWGCVWLSPTPDIVGSQGWDAALPRIATWALLRMRARPHVEVFAINTHLDHVGTEARIESAHMLRRMADARGGQPVLLMGDLNCGPGSPPYAALTAHSSTSGLRDPWVELSSPLAAAGTYHGFTGQEQSQRIDFVLCNDYWEAVAVDIDRRTGESTYPSDHYPVRATLRLRAVR